MSLAGDARLCVLAFDHRQSLRRMLREATGGEPDAAVIRDAKELVVDALLAVGCDQRAHRRVGLLIDEEHGGAAASRAQAGGVALVMPVERSGVDGFDALDDGLWQRTLARGPDYVKALLRANPDADADHLAAAHTRLRAAVERLEHDGHAVLVELLVPALPAQLAAVDGDVSRYDAELRPELTAREIDGLHAVGIEPALWKLEGFEDADAARHVVERVRSGGREQAGCLVLGRGADGERVEHWLRVAAGVAGFDGFAIGRSIWWEPLRAYLRGTGDRRTCQDEIGRGFQRCCELFDAVAGARH